MSVLRIAERYAKSLITFSEEQGALEISYQDMQYIAQVIALNDFASLLKSPIVKTDKKKAIFKEVFSNKISPLVNNFLQIVLVKRRESHLADIVKEFNNQYNIIKGITQLTITSATPLTKESQLSIETAIIASGSTLGKVKSTIKVDEKLIGGYKVEFDGKLLDNSISHKLSELRKEINSNKYAN